MPRPIHFEINPENPQGAIKFNTDLFGWTFSKWSGPQDYWLIKTGESGTPGIDGGLLPRHGAGPAAMQAPNAFVCTVDVPDLDAAMHKVGDLDTEIVVPKMALLAVGWLAFGHDTEGSIFGMMELDAQAK